MRMNRAVIIVCLVVIISGCVGPFSDGGGSGNGADEVESGGDGISSSNGRTGDGNSQEGVSVSDLSGKEDSEYGQASNGDYANGSLRADFIDVGQADSTLLKGPSANVLVDTGDWRSEDVVSYLESEDIETIDLIILTHLDADHIGQAEKIIKEFEVKEVWMSGRSRSTDTFEGLVRAMINSDVGYYEPRRGEAFRVGEMMFEVLHPVSTPTTSNSGIVTKVVFGESSFMFSGDAESGAESELVDSGVDLKSDVYQVGHHGSATSSTPEFVEAVDPRIAVYSAAVDSQYGHPDDEVIERLNRMGIELYGTPVHGTVVVEATRDGSLDVTTEKGESPITSPPGVITGGWMQQTETAEAITP